MPMYQSWVVIVVFHHLLSSITEFKNQVLPTPYVGFYEGENGNLFLK